MLRTGLLLAGSVEDISTVTAPKKAPAKRKVPASALGTYNINHDSF